MMMNFNLAPEPLGFQFIDAVLGHEGGYTNNQADRGGETNWGVTLETARKYGYVGAMLDMTREQAIAIYVSLFWSNRFDKIAAAGFPRLSYALLDFGVNSGPGRPAEAFQRALNVLNGCGKKWSDIAVDGGVGPITLASLAAAKAALTDSESLLTFAVNSLRVAFIINLAEKDPKQETFMLGWLRRFHQVAELSDQ